MGLQTKQKSCRLLVTVSLDWTEARGGMHKLLLMMDRRADVITKSASDSKLRLLCAFGSWVLAVHLAQETVGGVGLPLIDMSHICMPSMASCQVVNYF